MQDEEASAVKGVSKKQHLSLIPMIGNKCLIAKGPTTGTHTKHKNGGPVSSILMEIHTDFWNYYE